MQIRILYFGQLKDATGKPEERVSVEDGSTVGDLFEQCCSDYPRLAALRRSVAFARNQQFARPQQALAEGDEVAFLPPVSGG